jgi:NAD(P)-dependent dehydrogenase (short-subunit alcohol dehydrogenase family)
MAADNMKSILVTGACGGMGKAAVRLLASEGYRVFALDMRPCEAGKNVIPVAADVTDADSVRAALEAVRGYTDRLDAIVHFAGIYMLDSFAEIEDEQLERIFDVNLFGAMRINKAFLPLLSNDSRIIITTSELAPLDPLPFTGIYAVTKAALDKYAYSLQMELQLLGIKVSVLRAGAVQTDMLGVSTDALDRFCEKTQLYSYNAARFKKIVCGVEARSVSPDKIARKTLAILNKRRPAFAYSLNRNPLLLLLNALPKRLQLAAIKTVLK